MRALLSVYDKDGLVELAQGLSDLGWELVASGNTAARLGEAGIAHLEVAEVTGSPEMLGGRVKTLHPKIHGGILADRSKPEHLGDLEANGIEAIDLVVSNLYPFSSDPSIELIDIGGPAMVRAAAKNHEHVGIVTSPADYPVVLAELRAHGTLSAAARRRLARAAFAHTAAYDAAIVAWLDAGGPGPAAGLEGASGADAAEAELSAVLPQTLHLTLERTEVLRYGENPHQRGARYRVAGVPSWWDAMVQHSGTPLSYLNLFDGDAAWRLVHELADDAGEPAVAIVKHANPCGAAVAADLVTAYERALECDPLSAFGGVVAIGGDVTAEVAEAVAEGPQADVIIARSYAPEALQRLIARRKATRILSGPSPEPATRQLRSLGASVLVQDVDRFVSPRTEWRAVTKRQPSEEEWRDLVLAWRSAVARRPTPSPSSPTARPSASGPASSHASWPRRSPSRRRGSGPRAGPVPATPSSPSPTACSSWPTPALPPSSSPEDRSRTPRSLPPPTRPVSPWSPRASGTSSTDGRHPPRRRARRRPNERRGGCPRGPTRRRRHSRRSGHHPRRR